MILSCFFAALGQITDPRFRNVLLTGIGLTLALLIGATYGFVALLQMFVGDALTLPWIGEVTWVDNAVSIGGVLLMLTLSVFLMVPVASAITSMFLDTVAQAVEDVHYPNLPPADKIPFSDAMRDTLSFLGVMIAANLLALILYLFFPPAAPFIFWGLNGYLLGQEYFTVAAMRRVGRQRAKELYREHAATIWLAGTLMAMPLTVPLVNLLIPVIGAATFTHLFHRLTGAQARDRKTAYHQA